jgi:TldD protein
MTDLTKIASKSLLSDAHLDESQIETVLGQLLGTNIDSADIYLQDSQEESWFLEDGIVKEGEFSIDRGFGLRVISGEKSGFAFSDHIDLKALQQAASSAKRIARSGQPGKLKVFRHQPVDTLYPTSNPLNSLKETEKVEFLLQLDTLARQMDPRVQEVMLRLSGSYDVVLMMRSDGVIVSDIRPLVNLSVRVIVESNGRREQGMAGGGARSDYHLFSRDETAVAYVKKAVNQALTNLEAVSVTPGAMPVVLGPGWPAVILHEAIGHGLEGDFNRKGTSAFSGRMGQCVASKLCTIVDDGTIPGRRGSVTVDDEGTPGQRTVLIENGILKGYMQDRHNAALMGETSTGNGRRESYAHRPVPRMTNTYMLPGQSDPDEIIASVDQGIYVSDMSGGQVDITSGKFVFSTSEAYLIEQGRLTRPIKGATLIGNGPDILTRVSMVGNDLALDSGLGTCGKAGQTVPVGVGQPTLKIDEITVGSN